MASNPVHHRRTKHIELDIHFVREKVAIREVRILHVPTSQQFADIMTKGLPTSVFQEFRSSLGISAPDATTAGGCWRRGHVPVYSLHDPTFLDHVGPLEEAHVVLVYMYIYTNRSIQVALTLQSSFKYD